MRNGEERLMSDKYAKSSADSVICPWCDHAHQDVDNYCLPTDENPTWGECQECGQPFEVVKTEDHRYRTAKRSEEG